jgi:hypothetical protein
MLKNLFFFKLLQDNNFLRVVNKKAFSLNIVNKMSSELGSSENEKPAEQMLPPDQEQLDQNDKSHSGISPKERFVGMTYAEAKAERKRALKERRKQKLEQKQVGFCDDVLQHTDYYYENGLRKVYPYWFLWNTYVKERWFNRTLLDVYQTEFFRATRSHSLEHLISTGKIKVNSQVKPCDYVLKNGDKITHIKHRHEIPVLGDPIKIIQDDENYLVVDKPCSLPMHPCGKYRYNSLAIILNKEFGYSNLRSN